MFSRINIRSWSKIGVAGLAVLLAFDVCTAGGFLRSFLRCRMAPVCNTRFVQATPCAQPVVSTCSTPTYSQPLYEYPASNVVYENPVYETPVYESQSYAAPTCHNCAVTACDGMCGDYSNACGGGGVVVNECAGAIDLGYSDCCSAADTGGSYVVESASYESAYEGGYVSDGEVISDGYASYGEVINDGSIVDGGTIVSDDGYQGDGYQGDGYQGNIVSDGTIVGESVVEGYEGGAVDYGDSTIVDDGVIVQDGASNYSDSIESNNYSNDTVVEDANIQPQSVPEPSGVEPAAGDFATDDMAPIPQPGAREGDVADDLGDDLFGPDTDPMPADPVAADPVQNDPVDDSELDDLFNEAAPDNGGEFNADPPEASNDGVDEDLDALFGDGGGSNAGAGGGTNGGDFQEAGDDDLDSLFNDGGGDAGAPPSGDGDDLDSLFDTDASGESLDESDLDDLFGENVFPPLPGSQDTTPEPKLAEEPAQDEQATHMVSFVDNAMPFRTWWDDTGAYQTVGRLLIIEEDKVRLLKSNGRTCTVGFDRLSDSDLDYVQQQVEQYKKSLKVAAR